MSYAAKVVPTTMAPPAAEVTTNAPAGDGTTTNDGGNGKATTAAVDEQTPNVIEEVCSRALAVVCWSCVVVESWRDHWRCRGRLGVLHHSDCGAVLRVRRSQQATQGGRSNHGLFGR